MDASLFPRASAVHFEHQAWLTQEADHRGWRIHGVFCHGATCTIEEIPRTAGSRKAAIQNPQSAIFNSLCPGVLVVRFHFLRWNFRSTANVLFTGVISPTRSQAIPKVLAGLLSNVYFLSYMGLYLLLLVLLHAIEGFGLALPILILLVVGVGFSALAWWLTRGISPPPIDVKHATAESGLLVTYLLPLTAYLTWGVDFMERSFDTDAAKSLVGLVAKLSLFVAFPLALFCWFWAYGFHDFFGVSPDRRGLVWVTCWMSLALVLFQLAFGQGLNHIRAAGLGLWHVAIGIPFVYLWLVLEVGLVEEFFFRALIQARLTALLRSDIAGVVLMALLFGLAHAPGIYFRTARTLESVGPSPTWLMALGYSILVISPTGFFLGVLWARTKNLYLLALIHAAADLIPNTEQMLRTWQLG